MGGRVVGVRQRDLLSRSVCDLILLPRATAETLNNSSLYDGHGISRPARRFPIKPLALTRTIPYALLIYS